MEFGQDVVEPRPPGGLAAPPRSGQLPPLDQLGDIAPSGGRYSRSGMSGRFSPWFQENKRAITIYAVTRVGLLLLAIAGAAIFGTVVHGESLARELANWDGWWYVRIATLGYWDKVSRAQTTLGFFPLYPLAIYVVSHIFFCAYVIGGMIISTIGGLVATIQVQRLTTEWWGPEVGRKAVLLFCLFPGSIVFSMVYSEGLLIPLLLGCILALGHKRWVLAGVLAALCSAIGPDSLVVVPMCLTASFLELRKYGWQDREARRSLLAPLLSPLGAIAFFIFLWIWTGNPLADYIAQRYGWHEQTSPLAIPHQILLMIRQAGLHLHLWKVNPNIPVALLGTVFLIIGLKLVWRDRRTIPLEVLVFTWCMTILMVTSWHVPPDPRLLFTTFPVVLIFAKRLEGRAWTRMVWATAVLLIFMSLITYVGSIIRP